MQYKIIPLREDDEQVYLEAYICEKTQSFTRKAILVIPGGGYFNVCANREGEPVAHAFIPKGYNAFVLHYSVAKKRVFPSQLIEASLAMKHIKDNAEEYGIDKENIFVVGFSAGGHLAASLGTMWHKKEVYEAIDIPFGYNKPRGMMLIYPVISGVIEQRHKGSFKNLLGLDDPTQEQLKAVSIENNVDQNTVPAFLMHTTTDSTVPVYNSLIMAKALSDNGIKYEMHIYPEAPHGCALGNDITSNGNPNYVNSAIAKWVDHAADWAENLTY